MRLRIEQHIGRDVLVWAVSISLLSLSAIAEIPVGRVWERVDPRGSSLANDFTVFEDRLIAVGESGAIWSTTDRESWTTERSQSSANLTAVASGAGVVVAVGSDGTLLRSAGDGEWTREFPTSHSNFTSVAYGDGFVAVGDGGVALWSPDGAAWRDWPSGVPHHLNHVIWDGSAFHAVGDTGTVLTATPGGPWQSLIVPPSPFNDYAKIAAGDNGYAFSDGSPHQGMLYVGDQFVKVIEDGYVSYSEDGSDWIHHPTPDDAPFCAAAWTGDEFIAMTRLRGIVSSTDTLRWMSHGLDRNYLAGCWSGSRYIVVGASGAIASSGDGETWLSEQSPTDHLLRDVASGGGNLVAVGMEGAMLHSGDGQSWSQVEMLGEWDLYSVHWSGSQFWAVGTGGVILESPDGQVWGLNNPGNLDAVTWDGSRYLAFSGRNVLSSDDGNRWAVIAHIEQPPASTARSILHVRALIWDGSYFVAGAYNGYFFRSADGVNWDSGLSPNNFFSFDFGSIASSGSGYVALEANSSQWATSSDGLDWEFHAERILPSSPYRDITWDGHRFVVVGENKVFASADGADWSEIATVQPGTGTLFFRSVAWDGSRLIGVGQHYVHLGSTPTGFHATSTDGITWENFVAGGEEPFIGVATDGSTSVALGETGAVRRLTGSDWAIEQATIAGEPIRVLAGGGSFSIFSRSGMSCTSDQAGDWQPGTVRQNDEILVSFSSANGTLVAGGLTGILRSDNGVDWTREVLPPNSGPVVDIDWSGDQFVALGTRVYRSSTGSGWSQDDPEQSLTYGYCIEHFRGDAYVGTENGIADTLVWMEGAAGFEPVASGRNGAVVELISNGSELIAIGTSPLMTSTNGVDWTAPHTGTSLTGDLHEVVYTGAGFIACGEDGRLWRSSDGESWAAEPIEDFPALNAMIVNDGHLVGAGNRLVHSTDGAQWEINKVGSFRFLDVAFGDNKYVAITARSVPQGVAISADGIDWQSNPIDLDSGFSPRSITWTGTEFLMTSERSGTAASPDGINWEVVLLPRPIVGIAASETQQVAVTSTNDVYRSGDGLHWRRIESISSARGTVFTGGTFFTVGSRSFRSADGVDWQPIMSFNDIAWDGTQFVGVGYGGVAGISPDGVAWTTAPTGVTSTLNCLVYSGSEFIAVGDRGTAMRSTDGLNWTSIELNTTQKLEELAWLGDQFATLESGGTIIYSSTDHGQPAGIDVNAIWSDGGTTFVVGRSGRVAELIGDAWVEQDSGTTNSLLSITATSGGIRACGVGGIVIDRPPGGDWGGTAGWNDYRTAKLDFAPFNIGVSRDGGLIGFSESGVIASSQDGRTWNRIGGAGGAELNGFANSPSESFVVGEHGTIASISGASVVPQRSPVSSDLNAIAGGDDRLVAVGDDGVILLSRGGAEVAGGFYRWADDQGLDATQIDPVTDLGAGGISYLDAYYFALSPQAPERIHDRANLPFISSNLGVTFRASDTTPDLEITVERSTDLREWRSVAGKIGDGAWGGSHTVTITPDAAGTQIVTVEAPAPSGETAYYRVRLVRR